MKRNWGLDYQKLVINYLYMGLALVPNSFSQKIVSDIPLDPKKRWEWFHKTYGPILQSHIDVLTSICWHLPKWQGISFTEVQDGYVQAHYGKYSIYFPSDIDTKGLKIAQWVKQFDLVIDGNTTPIDTGISIVPPSIEVVAATKSKTSSTMNTLFPPRVPNISQTSKTILIKREIKIMKK